MTSYMVKAETHEGDIMTLRKGFASQGEAEDHPVTMKFWKRVWIEPDSTPAPVPKSKTLPPFPWNWVAAGKPSASGAFHAYLVDANGRKIAAIWGAESERALVADFIVDSCNISHQVDQNEKAFKRQSS
jgi:hypothetical protein